METNISYIPKYHKEAIAEGQTKANEGLARLRKLILSHGETLADAIAYQEKGGDYKVREEIARCQKWLDDTKAPQYLHQQSLDAAVNSFGAEALAYYSTLTPGTLNIHLGNLSSDPIIDLSTDVLEREDEWCVSGEYINNLLESKRRTLTAEEMEDVRAFREMANVMDDFAKRGYNPENVYKLRNIEDEARMAEELMFAKMFNMKK